VKHIAVLTHFYPPEPCAAATRVSSLVNALLKEGNRVTVVTNFASFPNGRVANEDRLRMTRTEESDGAHVVRLLTTTFRGMPGARLLHWLTSAMTLSTFVLTTREKFDAIVVSVPPITLAMPALLGAWRHRATLVADNRDVYPDVAIAMGKWRKDGILARTASFGMRVLYRNAKLVSAVTPTGLAQVGARGVPPSRLFLAPNGCEMPAVRGLQREKRDPGTFLAVYAGNLGLASDVDTLIDAAVLLRDDPGIAIEIVGDGVEGERLRKRVSDQGLHNVRLVGAVPRMQAMRAIASADVAIVLLRKGIRDSMPTKIFDALSVGCPVVLAAEGEARDAIVASRGGIAVPPGDAEALAKALRRLACAKNGTLDRIGARGRTFVERFYQRDVIMTGYSQRIAAL
jgi:glycosyltransferase involved in cell wall biosynthesis